MAAILRSIDQGFAPLVEKVIAQQAAAATRFAGYWANVSSERDQVCQVPLGRELALQVRGAWPLIGILNERLHVLAEWKEAEAKWTGAFAFGKKKAARAAVIPLGIQGIRPPEIERAAALYSGLKSRLRVVDIISIFEGAPGADSDTLPESLQHIDYGLRWSTTGTNFSATGCWPEREIASIARVQVYGSGCWCAGSVL